MRGRWLTPASLPSSTIQCVIEFPDSEEIRALVRGAIYLLSQEENYEAFGAVTPQEIADSMRQTLFLFNLEDCMVIPPGVCVDFAGDVIPDGWLDTDQGAVSRTTYAALFAAIGTQFGAGDGSTTFDLPHKDGRVTIGIKPGDSDYNVLGETGGAKTHALAVGDLPVHNHPIPVEIRDAGTSIPGNGNNFIPKISGSAGTARTHSTSNTGSATPFSIVQPYLTMRYIIKF